MAKIVDPDQLNDGVEIVISTAGKTIQLVATGNLDAADGVTGQAVYSKLKELWKNNATYIKFLFPMVSITEEKFDLVNGWDWADTNTRNYIRDAGWALKDGSNVSQEEYAGIITLGTFDNPATDTAYFQQVAAGAATNFVQPGPVNQAVKVYGDGTHGNIDYRSYFKAFLRVQGKTYDQYDLITLQNITALDYKVYKLPLSNAVDLKIATADVTIDPNSDGSTADAAAPWNGMTITYLVGNGFTPVAVTTYSLNDVVQDGAGRWAICTGAGTVTGGTAGSYTGFTGTATWAAYTGERSLDGGTNYYAFNKIVEANNASAQQTYEFVQWSLRQTVDIDAGAGTVTGQTADSLMFYVGDSLNTRNGVFIDNLAGTDLVATDFYDVGGTLREYPFVSAGVIQFNDNLVNDGAAIYRMFFDDPDDTPASNDEYGTAGAIIVKDNSNTDIAGNIAGSSVNFDFPYDLCTQTASNGVDRDVTVVCIGLTTGQFVSQGFTITASNSLVFSMNAPLERNYSNPV